MAPMLLELPREALLAAFMWCDPASFAALECTASSCAALVAAAVPAQARDVFDERPSRQREGEGWAAVAHRMVEERAERARRKCRRAEWRAERKKGRLELRRLEEQFSQLPPEEQCQQMAGAPGQAMMAIQQLCGGGPLPSPLEEGDEGYESEAEYLAYIDDMSAEDTDEDE